MKYDVILADPPWTYRDKCVAGDRGLANKYPTLSTQDLRALDVGALAAPDCALFLWATMPTLPDALTVMESWGFRYSTVAFVWVKTAPSGAHAKARRALRRVLADGTVADLAIDTLETLGLLSDGLAWGTGQSTRANVEVVLLGLRGKLGRVNAGVHQVVMAPPGKHSAKPVEVHNRINLLLGYRRRLELFARMRRVGWDAWGNEAPGGNDVEVKVRQRMVGRQKGIATRRARALHDVLAYMREAVPTAALGGKEQP